jgi:hypothetical protein
MLGTIAGFALLRRQRRASGGGGVSVVGWKTETLVQASSFVSGSVEIALTEVPFDAEAVQVDYNGQVLRALSEWSYSGAGNKVIIEFSDPYVETYDNAPIFQVQYPY